MLSTDKIVSITFEIIGLFIILSAVFNWKLFRRKNLDKIGKIARIMTGLLMLLTAFLYWKFAENENLQYWYYIQLILLAIFGGLEAGSKKHS